MYWVGQKVLSVSSIKWYMHACMLSRFGRVRLCATLWTAAHQAPLSTGFSRQEYWSGLPFPSPIKWYRKPQMNFWPTQYMCLYICKKILCVYVSCVCAHCVYVCVTHHVCTNIRLCVCTRTSVVCLNQHTLLPKYQFAIGKHS